MSNSNIVGHGAVGSASGWKVEMGGSDELERRKRRAERFSQGPSATTNSNDNLNEDFANLNAISSKSHQYDKKDSCGRALPNSREILSETNFRA
ncbi:BEM_collapsed_G0058360.mRNA.1.CDS.1 [Saccharomyces cerevisiae]|nr:BEM_collapsed_G0058360.mRNA.1.CDS.1 [Saccharomyces cerevisiae]